MRISTGSLSNRLSMMQRRVFLLSLARDASSVNESIRSAQAVELFRSAYYKASKSPATLSMTDITQVLLAERVRPSIFINLYETLGHISGTVARLAPIKDTEKLFTTAIDDAATQQLNDSIRNISDVENSDDVRETLKFHRDIRVERTENDSDVNEASNSSSGNSMADMVKQLNCKSVLSTSLYQVFKVAETL